MTKVIRRDNESVESMLRRFSKNVLQSRKLITLKERQHHVKPLKRKIKRVIAIKKSARLRRRLLR